MDQTEAKKLAAKAALELLPEAGTIGLGSGSTAKLFIDGVRELVKSGRQLRGVPTSDGSRAQAEALGIPLCTDEGPWEIAVTVDGADEVSSGLDLIKGGGGAHAREKIVNAASQTNVIIVDESKLSERLGQKWPIPLEILPFGRASTAKALEKFGQPALRLKDGKPWITDSGNFIYDLTVGPIAEPAEIEAQLLSLPGVVETGLFIGRADVVIVASESGVRQLRPA